MAAAIASTPLAAIEAVSLDTETTGLDAASARLVQIGAVRLAGERVDPADRFETLINPGMPIPARSTAIHGIADENVAGAPSAAEALPGLAQFIGDAVVIGHVIGFDLEILRREAERAGVSWTAPVALDVRTLAQIALPGLAAYDLDALCAHLEIEIEGRHTAMGDATATAQAFFALIPQLRQRDIRTLAEAQAASRLIGERAGAGTAPGTPPPALDQAHAFERIDSYPYRRRVADVMSAPPVTVPADGVLRDASARMIADSVSSVFVAEPDGETGIVTERDVLRALHQHGKDALDLPLRDIWSHPLATVSANDMIYRAIGRMDRLGIRHLGVTDEAGRLVGAVTTRNLLRHRATTAMILGDEIAAGGSETDLADAWSKTPVMAARLTDEGVDARLIAGVISAEIGMLTRRAAEIGEQRIRTAGRGAPPAQYAVLVLGSAGRGESLLAADQDNAIVFEDGADVEPCDAWFTELGGHIADILDQAGIPYCKGKVMAREAPWRRSLAGWKETIDGWIGRQKPEDLLNVDIFFDAQTVHGDAALGEAAWAYAYDRGAGSATFRRALADTLATWQSPVSLFGGFRKGADNRTDLKAGGLMPIFTAARVLSIKAGAKVRNTPDRLRAGAAAGLASPAQIESLVAAHEVILRTMLRQQIADIGNGVSPGPRVDTGILTSAERSALRHALRQVPGAIGLAREGML